MKCHYPFKLYSKKPYAAKITHFKHSVGAILKLLRFIIELYQPDLY